MPIFTMNKIYQISFAEDSTYAFAQIEYVAAPFEVA